MGIDERWRLPNATLIFRSQYDLVPALLIEHYADAVQMMRYRGKLQRSSYPLISVDPADEGAILEQKWRSWIEMEKWKR